jgi:hypothetical protein
MWPFRKREYEQVKVLDRNDVTWTFSGTCACQVCESVVEVTDAMKIKTHNDLPYPVWWSVKCPSCGSRIEVERQKVITPSASTARDEREGV